MKRYRTRDDDDDAFDERGLLKDGRSVRTSLMMRDSDSLTQLQKAVAQDSMQVTDGQGGTQGLHRPGFRILAADARKRTTHYDPKGRLKGYSTTEIEEEDEEKKHGTERQTLDAAMRARDKAYSDYEKRITTAYLNPVGFGGDPKSEQGDDHD